MGYDGRQREARGIEREAGLPLDPHRNHDGLNYYRGGDLVYAGKVGTGLDDETLKDLRGQLEGLEGESSPFDRGEPETKEVHFVRPELVYEVAFTEWTDSDHLRHPRYKGLRRDKMPEDVHKEDETQEADL
jgi:ATP-dependent DNA ligase